MTPPPLPPVPQTEAKRLATLRQYRIMDTARDPRFDRLATLAAELLDVPMAAISLLDDERVWFKARHGITLTGGSRCHAFCSHTLQRDTLLVIEDAAADPEFADNPLVRNAPHIRFYAGMPLKAANGQNLGALCVLDHQPRQLDAKARKLLHDLALLASDEIELHKQQLDARRHAEARARAEQTEQLLLHSINHEFRTPLNAVIGFAELLGDNIFGPTNPTQRDYLQVIRRSGGDILRLLVGVTDMADTMRGEAEPAYSDIEASEMLRDVVEQHRPLAQQHQIEIGFQGCERRCPLRLDKGWLTQALGNLIRNAIVYNRPQGAVEVGCEHETDGMVTLYVADTGLGIPARRRGDVFQMFNRLGRENSDIRGSGLGLALSKKLVETMGGSIGFESIEGQGSRFWTRFQAA